MTATGTVARVLAGPVNGFTVDVEDWFQVSAFADHFPRSSWDGVPLRFESGVHRLLDLLDEAGARGTFFVLGWIAERRPDVVAEIARRGHEIGCHSFEHRLVYDLSPDEFRLDLRRALAAIEAATGGRCTLYRAPSFSVTGRSLWALPIMAEEGITIDSSIYPVRHDRYGMPDAPRAPFRPLADHPAFVEFPPASFRFFGMTLPCVGGGYLRLFPLALTRHALRQINGGEGRPALLYVHPWELDPEQPVAPAGAVTNWRHRVNLARTAPRLRSLLESHRFGTLSEAVEQAGGAAAMPLWPVER